MKISKEREIKMNVLEFINSKDIAKHFKDIGYEFNSVECAFIIAQNKKYSIMTKHAAWHDLMKNMPDMPLPDTNDDSLFDFLQKLMDIEDEILEIFYEYNNPSYSSSYTILEKDFSFPERKKLSDLAEYITRSGDVVIRKSIIYNDGKSDVIKVLLNEKYKAKKIVSAFFESTSEKNYSRYYNAFNKWNLSFELPFKKGDILQYKQGNSYLYFVFDSLGYSDKIHYTSEEYLIYETVHPTSFPDESVQRGNKCNVYECTETGKVQRSIYTNILNLEYCNRNAYINMDVLKNVSDFITKKSDFVQLLSSYHSCMIRKLCWNLSYND